VVGAGSWPGAGDTTPPFPHPMSHHVNAFWLTYGRDFRLIQFEDGTGHAQHCPYALVWRGRINDGPASGTSLRRATATGLIGCGFSGSARLLRNPPGVMGIGR
jgi:hypothetical protein